jgi:hypothetical protein
VSDTDSFGARSTLDAGGERFEIFRLDALAGDHEIERLPYSLKILRWPAGIRPPIRRSRSRTRPRAC